MICEISSILLSLSGPQSHSGNNKKKKAKKN
jgi:hypothetical protein